MTPHLSDLLYKLLHASKPLTFVLMMCFAGTGGLASLNLFSLLRANINLFLDNGLMVIDDGALRQLFGLLFYGAVSTASYVLFKACEHVLVGAILLPPFRSPNADAAAGAPPH